MTPGMMSPSSESQRLSELRARFPEAPSAELLRFARARPNSTAQAIEMYEAHLQWRAGPGSPDKLLEAAEEVGPKYIRQHGKALDGTPILFVQGARYDEGVSPESYALACAHALDRLFGPEDDGKITLLIDTRPGEGWPNASAHKMLPFFRLACNLLPSNYPERMQRVVLYPVPMILRQLWNVVRGFMDPRTSSKFLVLSGSASFGAPAPRELSDVVALDELPFDVQSTHEALRSD